MYNVSDPDDKDASLRSWNMTFSHIDIEPGILWVDAVTIEREVAMGDNGSTLTYNFTNYETQLGPSAIRLIPKGKNIKDESIDVLAICAVSEQEDVQLERVTENKLSKKIKYSKTCEKQVSNALLVVGNGHRWIGDALKNDDDTVVTNVRMVSTVTAAHIGWKHQDLAAAYHAECDAKSGCMGLDVELPGTRRRRRLVVSESALPLVVLPDGSTALTPLVAVRHPTKKIAGALPNPAIIGDPLFPHNIHHGRAFMGNNTQASMAACIGWPMYRLATVVNNHIYMEHSLQPTYTAGLLFLLQDGVVKDVLNQTWTKERMLAFEGNTQDVDVYVYIPELNAMITLAGCSLLVLAIAIAVVWPQIGLRGQTDPLTHITTPHTIARVLLDSNAFPAPLLTRNVTPSAEGTTAGNADDYQIQTLLLERKEDNEDEPTNRV